MGIRTQTEYRPNAMVHAMGASTPRRRFRLGIVVLTCAIVTAGFVPAISVRGATSQSADTVRKLVNDSRISAGRTTLPMESSVADIAKQHASRMRDQGRIYHNPNVSEELDARGVDWSRWGENVGVGPSVEDVHTGFMESSVHKANILDGGFDAIGTGVAFGKYGRVFVAQVFVKMRTRQPPPPPPAQPAPIASKLPPEPAAAEAVTQSAPPAPSVEAAPVEEAPTPVPPGHILLEDGSIVPSSYFSHARNDPCGSAYTVAYDGTVIPTVFEVSDAGC